MKAIVPTPGVALSDPRSLVEVDLPSPCPGDLDLLVRVKAIGVNPVDTKVRAALAADTATPRVLGWDAAGIVEAAGPSTGRFQPGDAVIFAGDISRPGCNAELVAVDERLCGRRPGTLSFAEAAALPLTSLTAWESLFDRLGLDPDGGDAGRSLLILGGGGGVGSIAIQMARLAGLMVIATASRPESQTWVREMGAAHVIDHNQPLAPQLSALGFEAVDAIANFADTDAYWEAMAALIRPQGAIVAIVANRRPLDLNLLKDKSVRFAWEFMFTRAKYGTPDMARQGAVLDGMAELIDAGRLRTTLRTHLAPISAANLRQAHAQLESGRTIGKLVLDGWP
jgi:zinc-binding alcohol dehydrogenase family protein